MPRSLPSGSESFPLTLPLSPLFAPSPPLCKKKVVTVGQSNKIELWSEEIWNGGMENWLSAKGSQSLLDSEEFGSLQI